MTPELTMALTLAASKLREIGFENTAAVLELGVNGLAAEVKRLEDVLKEAADFVEAFDQGACEVDRGYCMRHHELVLAGSHICPDGRGPEDLLPRIRAALS